jgi:serine/threonine-protein kinase HipA
MTRRPDLRIWLYGTHIATLRDDAPGRPGLRWESQALDRWPINSTVLSVLLPITPAAPPPPARIRAFFAGLMPEGDARLHLAVDAGIEPDDVFGMMAAYGRDVAGAVILQPGDDPPSAKGRLRPISDRQVRSRLERAESNDAPLGIVAGVTSISLAGLQPKIALYRGPDGTWMECLDGAASTHIIKPGRPEGSPVADLIHNEAFCLRLARALGLTTVDAEILTFDGREALVVSRYDREITARAIERIHQEDCAQMLGLNTDNPARKFQHGRPLPSLRGIAAILDREYAPMSPLLAVTTFNVAIGNTDAHAKNLSVLHPGDGSLALAPIYDVSPHRHYALGERRSAMDINAVQDIDAVTAGDLIAEAESWGVRPADARDVVHGTLDRLRSELTRSTASDRVGVPEEAFTTMERRVDRLIEGKPAGAA